MIYKFVSDKINNVQDIEEVTNDILIKINNKPQYEDFDLSKNQFSTMIYLTAKNTVIDFKRTDHQSIYLSISDCNRTQITDDCKTNDLVENKELSLTILKAINILRPKYKRIAELFFLEDKPYLEIATLLNLPLGTVKPMIQRIRTMLRSNNELKNAYQMYN